MRNFERRVALLHLAPRVGELDSNRQALEAAMRRAAEAGADWVVTPELSTSGYEFSAVLGTDWIGGATDPWMARVSTLTEELGVCLFLHQPEREAQSLFSTLFALDRSGSIVGTHRKLRPIAGAEDWASPARDMSAPVEIDGVRVGMLVCADAYSPRPSASLAAAGAEVLLSSAAWHPGEWGPAGEWEARSAELGLPVIVCNRTGEDVRASFVKAQSVVAWKGARVFSRSAQRPTIFLLSLAFGGDALLREVERIDLEA